MVTERGEIWWAALPAPPGSQPGFRRPVLIIQSDAFSASRLRTVIAVLLTGNTRLAEKPGNVLLPRKSTGLPKDSVANVTQLGTLDEDLLEKQVGIIPRLLMAQVEAGLRLVLDL